MSEMAREALIERETVDFSEQPDDEQPGVEEPGVEPSNTEKSRSRRRTTGIPFMNSTTSTTQFYESSEKFVRDMLENPEQLFEFVTTHITALQVEMKEKDRQISMLIEERDEYKDTLARWAVRQADPESLMTRLSPPVEIHSKSEKVDDPVALTDGKTPRFEDWLSKMRNKLRANEDRYCTEDLRMIYVESRTEGTAAKHLAPRRRAHAVNKFRTAEEMFQHLEKVLSDPNKRINARRDFKALQMKPSDNYNDFLVEFLYLADEAGIPEVEHKEELYEKLTFELKKMMIMYRDDGSSFDDFSSRCSRAANTLQDIYASRKRGKSDEESRTTSSPVVESRKRENISSRAETVVSKFFMDPDKQEMMKKGLCFNCKGRGHLSKDCPLKGAKGQTSGLKQIEDDTLEEKSENLKP
jgi:hypothetical protein